MSAPYVETIATPVAVLVASLLGSAHCVGMCGPLALQASPNVRSLFAYHGGRGIAYVALGSLAGAAGETFLPAAPVGWIATIALAAYFLWAAYRLVRSRPEATLFPRMLVSSLQRPLGRLLPAASRQWPAAFGTGALTALLPCGWLHTFVVGAVATKSAVSGGLLLAAFWLGSVPALAGGAVLLRRWVLPGRARSTMAALLLVATALGTVWVRAAPSLRGNAQETIAGPHCGH